MRIKSRTRGCTRGFFCSSIKVTGGGGNNKNRTAERMTRGTEWLVCSGTATVVQRQESAWKSRTDSLWEKPTTVVVAAVPGVAPQSSTETSIIIIMIVKELVVFKLNDFSSSADIYKRRPPLFVFRAAVISYHWAVSRPCSSCNAGTNVNHHRHHRPRRLRRRLEWWCRRGGRKTCMKPIWMDWRFIGRRSGSSGDHH